MRLFKYLSTKSTKEMYDIFNVVSSLKKYAQIKYKDNYEDALDASYMHIVEHYDSSKGDLKNYAIKVVGTIGLGSNKKELANEEQTRLSLDSKTASEFFNSPIDSLEENFKSSNINSCIKDMVSLFVKDFKFFATQSTKYRKMDYKELLDKYSVESIVNAKNYLMEKYSKEIEKFISYSKVASIRNFNEDRYLKSLDTSLEYKGSLNDIILIKRKQGSHVKKVYRVLIEENINTLLDLFYTNTDYGKILIADVPIYLSLSGKIVDSEEELRCSLERELVGSLLSRTSLKVIHYDKGNEILLSSTKDVQYSVVLPLFDKNVSIDFERVVIKEV